MQSVRAPDDAALENAIADLIRADAVSGAIDATIRSAQAAAGCRDPRGLAGYAIDVMRAGRVADVKRIFDLAIGRPVRRKTRAQMYDASGRTLH